MNWKNEAISKLQRYKFMRQALCSIPQELKQLELNSQRIPSVSPDPLCADSNPPLSREDRMLNNILLQEELERALEQAQLWVQNVDHSLSLLNPPSRQLLLELYAMENPKPLSRLCRDLGVEKTSLYRMRNEALAQFTLGIYGFLES